MPDPFRKKPPVSGRIKALHSGLTELQQASRATQQAQLAQFVQAGAHLAAANEARYRLQMRTSHLVASQDATSRYATHLRQPLNPRQQALVQQTQARQLYLASRAVVRPDVRSEAQRRADHAAGVLQRQTNLAAVLNPGTAAAARHDPVLRAVAGTVVLVVAAEVVAAQAAAWTWRSVTVETFALKSGISVTGQFLGNYLYTHDAVESISTVNLLSAAASGVNMPLSFNSAWSASFNWSYKNDFKSLPTGEITPFEFGRDAAFNYGFGKVSAGFKMPGTAGRPWVGVDNLHKTPEVAHTIGFTTYQAMLRLGPRFGYGLGLGLTTAAEQGNKIASGATKKYLNTELKKQLPDPNK